MPSPVHADIRVHRDPHAPAQVRRWAHASLAATADGWLDDVLLVASELVSNAVDHGAEPISVTLDGSGSEVVVEVRDGGDGWPIQVQAESAGVRGRGLKIVETLSTEWGVTYHDSGKTVWARIGSRPTHGQDRAVPP